MFYWPQGAASCYCHSIGCSTVTNTGDGGEHVMIVPYEILLVVYDLLTVDAEISYVLNFL